MVTIVYLKKKSVAVFEMLMALQNASSIAKHRCRCELGLPHGAAKKASGF
jgi:hypothetical protein